MAKIANSITDLVGGTPLLRLARYEKAHGLGCAILGKVEYFNPAGSVKDRIAWSMIREAEVTGRLSPGGTIIEPTSGNTGIGLAAIAAARGYKIILTMPDTMSIERRKLLAAYGAEIVLTDGTLGMKGAIAKAEALTASTPGAYMPQQFQNPANPQTHLETTGPEIWTDTDGHIDMLVAGIGTGGTISGVGAYLKSKNPAITVVAVEPVDSPVLSGGCAGPHKLQGIGAGFVPAALDIHIFDEIIKVADEDAYRTVRELAKTEGVLVGVSSGAALWAASLAAMRPELAGKVIVTIFPDTGERYLSTPLFDF